MVGAGRASNIPLGLLSNLANRVVVSRSVLFLLYKALVEESDEKIIVFLFDGSIFVAFSSHFTGEQTLIDRVFLTWRVGWCLARISIFQIGLPSHRLFESLSVEQRNLGGPFACWDRQHVPFACLVLVRTLLFYFVRSARNALKLISRRPIYYSSW
jgi:hypothetical protein